jgi:hypothetical protein
VSIPDQRKPEPLPRRGVLLAGAALPGAGKSTVFRALSKLTGWPCFVEPEEPDWPPAVHDQSISGTFTALTWFRSVRVPQLFRAAALRDAGEIVLVDSYYDKLMGHYIRKPEMRWLFDPRDPYFRLSAELAELDARILPDADVVIFFRMTRGLWKRLIHTRNRDRDRRRVFPHAFDFQDHLLESVKAHTRATGGKMLVFDPPFTSPDIAAQLLLTEILDLDH